VSLPTLVSLRYLLRRKIARSNKYCRKLKVTTLVWLSVAYRLCCLKFREIVVGAEISRRTHTDSHDHPNMLFFSHASQEGIATLVLLKRKCGLASDTADESCMVRSPVMSQQAYVSFINNFLRSCHEGLMKYLFSRRNVYAYNLLCCDYIILCADGRVISFEN